MSVKIQIQEVETTWGKIEIGLLDGQVVRCTLPFLAKPPDDPFAIKEAGNDSASRFVAATLTFRDGSSDENGNGTPAGGSAASPTCRRSVPPAPEKYGNTFVKGENLPSLGKLEGTAFQQAVWRAIARIPFGETQTYGELACAVGRPGACRAVANACGQNPVPLFIPCHRVVAATGKIGGFSAGLPWKTLLLASEGWKTTLSCPYFTGSSRTSSNMGNAE